MGFGSYDESEQENQEIETELNEDDVATAEADHDGDLEYEIDATNDELLDQLHEIQDHEAE